MSAAVDVPVCRYTDPDSGVVAEVGTDGVPTGLALPEALLRRRSSEVAAAALRALTAAGAAARELLEALAEEEFEAGRFEAGRFDAGESEAPEPDPADAEARR